jgi:hypothetical protein
MYRLLAARTVPLLLAGLLLPGCVGVLFPGARTETVTEPIVGEKLNGEYQLGSDLGLRMLT